MLEEAYPLDTQCAAIPQVYEHENRTIVLSDLWLGHTERLSLWWDQ